MAANKSRLRLVNYMSDSLGLSQSPKDILNDENLDAAAAELISSLRAEINELKKRRDLYSLNEVEIVALAGEHTLALVKATKEAERNALTEIEKRLTAARKESDRLLKQSEVQSLAAQNTAAKLVADAEVQKAQIEGRAEQLKIDTENRIKIQLESLRREIDQRRNASVKEAEKIIDDAVATSEAKLLKTRTVIATELARERAKIEQIRREATSVAKSLETGYLSIRDQIDTARTTLGQYTSGLEDLTNILSEQDILSEDNT